MCYQKYSRVMSASQYIYFYFTYNRSLLMNRIYIMSSSSFFPMRFIFFILFIFEFAVFISNPFNDMSFILQLYVVIVIKIHFHFLWIHKYLHRKKEQNQTKKHCEQYDENMTHQSRLDSNTRTYNFETNTCSR